MIEYHGRITLKFDEFKWVVEKGSYGLLYIQDDEDEREDYSGKFRALVLKRGKLEEKEDHFLSPFFPECEKEYLLQLKR